MMDTTITMSSCMVVTITTTTSVLSPRNRWATIKPRWQLVVGIPYKLLIYELFIYLPTPLPPPPVSLDVPSCHKVPVNANNPCVTPNPVVRTAIQTNLADNTWLGYNNDTVQITLHLGKKQRVRQVLLNFLQNEGSWIFLPQSIHIAYRDTKTGKLIPLGSELIPPDQPNRDTQCHPKTIKAPRKCQTDRLIITICPLAKMPEWHTAKGEHAWTFLDGDNCLVTS